MAVTSTVVDGALAMLLLSAAVVVVAQPAGFPGRFDGSSGADTDPGSADATLDALATVTANVAYSLSPGARHADPSVVAFPRQEGPEFRRSRHGSLLELLVRATLATVTVEGEGLTHTGDGLRAAVRDPVDEVLDRNARVVVYWAPYPGAPVRARFDSGAEPPTDGSVHGATAHVPLGPGATVSSAARRRAISEGYPGVARLAATRTVAVVFPEGPTTLALGDDYPLASLVAYRYQRFAGAIDLDLAEPLAERDARAANRRLTGALASTLEADLRERYESPVDAARALTVGHVTVVVRTWSM